MRFRKLRIAWSVTCGIVAVLLVVLWVRSYKTGKIIYTNPSLSEMLVSGVSHRKIVMIRSDGGLVHSSYVPDHYEYFAARRSGHSPRTVFALVGVGLTLETSGGGTFAVPHWLLLTAITTIGAIPWLPYRFSLRTLLFATTLVAVVLGLMVWLR